MINDEPKFMKLYAKKKMSTAPAMPLDISTAKDSGAANGKCKGGSRDFNGKVSFEIHLSPSFCKDLQCIGRGNRRAHCVINRFRWKQYAKAKNREERCENFLDF